MADESKTLKPKSFRIDDETANKFKEISNSIGGNQQETLAKLIEAFEFQSGKAILTDKKADIEQFERYVTALTRMFMGALEDNQNVTETVRTEFDALLKSKDDVIQDLQTKLKVAQDLKNNAIEKARQYSDENARLEKELEELKADRETKVNDLNTMLNDKEQLNKALTDSCNNLKEQVESMTAECKEIAEIRTQLADITAERDKLINNKAELENELNKANKEHDKAIKEQQEHEKEALKQIEAGLKVEHDKAILNLEKKYQKQIQGLKDEKAKQVDEYQQKYFKLLERMNGDADAEEKLEKFKNSK